MLLSESVWKKCFAHIDMVSFFASVEQLDFPELAGKPVAVTNGDSGTTIITASYEARAFGIKTGTKVYEARKCCPNLIQRPSRPRRYVEISKRIMAALKMVTPDIEVFSIDECFLELTHVLSLYENIEAIALEIRQTVSAASNGLPCSIGISEGKLTAKFCSEYHKGSTTIMPPDKIKVFMSEAKVGKICGIGSRMEQSLNKLGIVTCKDLEKWPMSVLSNRFGNIGKRLYLTCLGHDPEPIQTQPKPAKSMGHGKILPPNCTNKTLIASTLYHLCEKLTARMREHNLAATQYFVGLKTPFGWLALEIKLTSASNHSALLWRKARTVLLQYHGDVIKQVQVTAISLIDGHIRQLDLFDNEEKEKALQQETKLDQVKDAINTKFGSKAITPASILLTQNNVPVIAPAWRPEGLRQTIADI